MATKSEADRELEVYLAELRKALRGLPAADADDIVSELRSHVREIAASAAQPGARAVRDSLERLGAPRELAARYLTERAIGEARGAFAPLRLLRALLRWARFSVAGGVLFVTLLVGYAVSLSFVIAALHKPFAPEGTGLFRESDGYSLHLGFAQPPGAEELLGWWLVPLGLGLGGFGVFALTWFARRSLQKLVRSAGRRRGEEAPR